MTQGLPPHPDEDVPSRRRRVSPHRMRERADEMAVLLDRAAPEVRAARRRRSASIPAAVAAFGALTVGGVGLAFGFAPTPTGTQMSMPSLPEEDPDGAATVTPTASARVTGTAGSDDGDAVLADASPITGGAGGAGRTRGPDGAEAANRAGRARPEAPARSTRAGAPRPTSGPRTTTPRPTSARPGPTSGRTTTTAPTERSATTTGEPEAPEEDAGTGASRSADLSGGPGDRSAEDDGTDSWTDSAGGAVE